jgi:uncharacterized protein YdeI (YjbR/CyaY-like superfamily)
MQRETRIDTYIERAEPFAQLILNHLREVVHKACPDVVETIKWGMPFFEYQGPLCSMAAFKQHVTFGFWKASLIPGIKDAARSKEDAMGSLGKLTTIADLPSEAGLIRFIQEAMKLNEQGIVAPERRKKPADRTLEVPEYLQQALDRNKKANAIFENFNFSNKRDYVEWLTEAKTEETRAKRLATTIEWLSEGKPRMWKYLKK